MPTLRIELVVLLLASSALAAPPRDAVADEAQGHFVRGTQLVREARWAEALASFEKARAVKPHPITTFNIAACERAIGHLTVARAAFRQALAENDGGQLPAAFATEAKGLVAELDGVVARLALTVAPDGVALALDGRPLQTEGEVKVAGTRAPGPGETIPSERFVVELDPGAHVLVFSRQGYRDQVVRRTLEPGARESMTLSLDRLPGTLHVSSEQDGALVTVDEKDLGPVPVDVLRPAGPHLVTVSLKGFVPLESRVVLQAGEETDLRASLKPEPPAFYTRWWFWTGVAVVAAGAAVGTWAATRPAPRTPDIGGGSLGWQVELP